MEDPESRSTRDLLEAAVQGEQQATDRLVEVLYDELRAVAIAALRTERPGHSIEATALVHEAYLRLVGPRKVPWQGRGHFFTAAAEAMRRVILDHARARGRQKRGGGRERIDLEAGASLAGTDDDSRLAEQLSLQDALLSLESRDSRAACVVRLRFYAGLPIAEVADILSIAERTVRADWAFARAWLAKELDSEASSAESDRARGGAS